MDRTGITVEGFEPRSISEDALREIHALRAGQTAEESPHDQPMPFEILAAMLANLPEFMATRLLLARDRSGEAVGFAYLTHRRTGANPHLVEVQLWADPAHRRRGAAQALLEAVVATAESDGYSLMRTNTTAGAGWGENLCRVIGGRVTVERRTWRLGLDTVDRDEIRLIAAQAAERARGYVLEEVSGALPDEIVGEAVELLHFLNEEAPDGALEDARITVGILREMEETWRAMDLRRRWLFARHEPSGGLAGVVDGVWHPLAPVTIVQNNSVVRPEFRGRSLALWMKACLIDKLLDEWPEARDIRTTTSYPNHAMDSVDGRLGFEPYVRSTVWLLELDAVKKWLDASHH